MRRAVSIARLLLIVVLVALALPSRAAGEHIPDDIPSTGPIGGNGPFEAYFGGTSADGTHVFFETNEKLVAADTDSFQDVYERLVLESGGVQTTLLSLGPSGGNGAVQANYAAASADGGRVFFHTRESLVAGDTDAYLDVYEYVAGTVNKLTPGNGSFDAFLTGNSLNGTKVFFETFESLAGGDSDGFSDVYEASGGSATLLSTGANNNFDSFYSGASEDGSKVFIDSYDALAAGDTDGGKRDVYESSGGGTTLVSVGASAYDVFYADASADGTHVFMRTEDSLDPADTDTFSYDIYERLGGTTYWTSQGANAVFDAVWNDVTRDGLQAFFETEEQLAGGGDTDTKYDVYERSGGTTTRVSTGLGGGNGAFAASFHGISTDDGRVFFSTAEQLAAGDTDAVTDVFQRFGGATTWISQGAVGGNGPHDAFFGGISSDGTRVFFSTFETLATADGDAGTGLDVYERSIPGTTLVSVGANGPESALFLGVTPNGNRVFIHTPEQLLPSDTDGLHDVYIADFGYARPNGAAKMRWSFVPAMAACSASDTAHGSPLNRPSCTTVTHQTNSLLTPNDDSTVANGSLTMQFVCSNGGVPPSCGAAGDQADIRLNVRSFDTRCKPGGPLPPAKCGASNTSPGADYIGPLLAVVPIRVTDRMNGASLADNGTVLDTTFSFGVQCAETASDPARGGSCVLTTSAEAVIASYATENKRMLVAARQPTLYDAGEDGALTAGAFACPPSCVGNGDEDPWMRPGIFVP